MTIGQLIALYSATPRPLRGTALDDLQRNAPTAIDGVPIALRGKVVEMRGSNGNRRTYYALLDDGSGRIQLRMNRARMHDDDFWLVASNVVTGDVLQVTGVVYWTHRHTLAFDVRTAEK